MASVRARVFISCGQRGGDERALADRVADVLSDLGFEPYVAVQEQTLKGLRDNIFWRLAHSEYFLFIDFKRDQLANTPDHRGSLFSHQELGIASFLDLDVIALQEQGVLQADGLMRYLQTNAEVFQDRGDLPDFVRRRIEAGVWRTGWRNELKLAMSDPPFVDTIARNEEGQPANRFFQLEVRNQHDRNTALNCVATVESITRPGIPPKEREMKLVEVRWSGSTVAAALIPPRLARQVDLGFVPLLALNTFAFNSFSTSTEYLPPLQGPGVFNVTYLVASTGFEAARFTAKVTLGELNGRIDDAWVEEA